MYASIGSKDANISTEIGTPSATDLSQRSADLFEPCPPPVNTSQEREAEADGDWQMIENDISERVEENQLENELSDMHVSGDGASDIAVSFCACEALRVFISVLCLGSCSARCIRHATRLQTAKDQCIVVFVERHS